MRKIILVLLILTMLSNCHHAPKFDTTVYITASGQKYHKKHCRYVRNKEIDIMLSKALYKGYEPCKVCKPSTKEDLEKMNEGT